MGGINRSDDFLGYLARSGVRNASLWGCAMTDHAADILASSPSLHEIAIYTGTCTDSTPQHLASSTSITRIELGSDVVTDAGLNALALMKQLKRVHFITCPKVTDQAIAKLRRELPHADIGR